MRKALVLVLLLVGWPAASPASSPYLEDHATDAVRWRPWGEAALAEAAASGRPLLLSIGYASCRWCHVMQRETFRDPAMGELIDRLTVPVLVDREMQPDIDAHFQEVARNRGWQTGWPLTLFLTPDGRPILGGGYFPPEPRGGMLSFREVLDQAVALYRQGKTAADTGKRHHGQPASGGDAFVRLAAEADPFEGGFGMAPKHPRLPALLALWRASLREDRPDWREIVTLSLERMALGGLQDHVGGGFFRYAVDAAWREPHFEKMLDLNAAMLSLLVEVWKETRSPLLESRIRSTVRFLLDDMRLPGGGFGSGLDAESDGRDGGAYLWSEAAIRDGLGSDADTFLEAFGLTEAGVLYQKGKGNRNAALDRLRAARKARSRLDDKVLADANGLAIAALAEAGAALGESGWIAAAEDAWRFVTRHLMSGEGLLHRWRDGRSGGSVLDDHGAMAGAALTLFEVTGREEYLEEAGRIVDWADGFRDPASGAYFLARAAAVPGLPRPRKDMDGAGPSGTALMADALARLYHLTGEEGFRTRAEAASRATLPEAGAAPVQHGGILAAADVLDNGMEIVIVGDRQAATPLLDVVFRTAVPGRALQVVPPGAEFPEHHPAFRKHQVDGLPTAYVCVATVCSLPVIHPSNLRENLKAMRPKYSSAPPPSAPPAARRRSGASGRSGACRRAPPSRPPFFDGTVADAVSEDHGLGYGPVARIAVERGGVKFRKVHFCALFQEGH